MSGDVYAFGMVIAEVSRSRCEAPVQISGIPDYANRILLIVAHEEETILANRTPQPHDPSHHRTQREAIAGGHHSGLLCSSSGDDT